MRWQNKNMFWLFLIATQIVVVYPFQPMWIGWIFAGIGGYLTGWFLKGWLIEKYKLKNGRN
jgi:hypothetical protein